MSNICEELRNGNLNLDSQFIEMLQRDNDNDCLLYILSTTDNVEYINKISLYFADINYYKSLSIIMNLINRNDFQNINGTLIYSVINFDCSEYLLDFIKLLSSNNFEAREMSLFVLEEINYQDINNDIIIYARECIYSKLSDKNYIYAYDWLKEALKIIPPNSTH